MLNRTECYNVSQTWQHIHIWWGIIQEHTHSFSHAILTACHTFCLNLQQCSIYGQSPYRNHTAKADIVKSLPHWGGKNQMKSIDIYIPQKSVDSQYRVVCTVTRLWTKRSGVPIPARIWGFSLLQIVQTGYEAQPAYY